MNNGQQISEGYNTFVADQFHLMLHVVLWALVVLALVWGWSLYQQRRRR